MLKTISFKVFLLSIKIIQWSAGLFLLRIFDINRPYGPITQKELASVIVDLTVGLPRCLAWMLGENLSI